MRVSLAYNEDHWHKGVHRRICYSICLWDEKRQKKTTGAHSILIDTFGYLRQYFSRMIDSFWVLLVSKSMACWLIQYWVGKTGSESRRLYIDSLDVYTTRGSYLNRNRQDIRIIVISSGFYHCGLLYAHFMWVIVASGRSGIIPSKSRRNGGYRPTAKQDPEFRKINSIPLRPSKPMRLECAGHPRVLDLLERFV